MIRLYVASEKLTKENRDIRVRLILPATEPDIWMALQKTEMTSLDDCEIFDVECEFEAVDCFLKSLNLAKADIFELNTFAGMLSKMRERELEEYCERLKNTRMNSLKEAIYGA